MHEILMQRESGIRWYQRSRYLSEFKLIFLISLRHGFVQWVTKVVESLLENDAFRCLTSYSILYKSGVVNSLILPAPQFDVVWALWSVQS